MSDLILVTLGVLALLSIVSFKEERLKALVGMGWIACGLFVFYDIHIIFLFLSVGTGLFLLLTGVMELYD